VKYLLVLLLATAATAEPWYQKHPPFCHQETWQSVGEAAGYGTALPTGIYYATVAVKRPKTQQAAMGRIMAVHFLTMTAMMIAWRNQTAPHDNDARWMNPAMVCMFSMGGNILVDALTRRR
jgi:hypothetical protein